MPLTGHHRGIPAVRFMIEQTQRRRMWSAQSQEREEAEAEPSAASVRRWGREFFDRVREVLVPRMAVIAETPEGQLRYLGSPAMSLWALVSEHALVVAHEYADTPEQ